MSLSEARIVVVGGGGHAAVVIDALLASGAAIQGICDPALTPLSEGRLGIPVLGGDDVIEQLDPSEICLANGVGSVGKTARRTEPFHYFKKRGFDFVTVVHPSAVVAHGVHLGEGAQVMAGVVIQTGVTIGDNAVVNTSTMVDHDCSIGQGAFLAPGVVLSGNVAVGDGTHVGTGARTIQNVRIGANVIIGAGVIVLADVPEGTTIYPSKTPVWGTNSLDESAR